MADQDKTPHIAHKLKDLGYVGATGDTPYKLPTPEQLSELQRLYDDKNFTNVPRVVPSNAININVNFDGTHNNGLYPAKGESPTNIHELSKLQRLALGANPDNTIYMPGVGAQSVPTGTLHPASGNPALEASPSNLKAFPIPAGKEAKEILEKAFRQLEERINATLAGNPKAEICINLTGFSRGAAQAVAFANMLNERGIGPFKPGDARIANMLLLDPVDQTDRALNTKPPTNVANTLVMVATAEGRNIMPAMQVSKDARLQGVPVVHSGLGGSYNPEGTAAVVLQKGKEFLEKGGVPMADIPSSLKPEWKQMYIHNSSVNNYGVPKLGADENTWENKPSRYYEGASRHAPSVQETLKNLPSYSKPELQELKTEQHKDKQLNERSEQGTSLDNQKPPNGYPKPNWEDWSKPIRKFNDDGTSGLYTLNPDGVVINYKQLDVNGVEVNPRISVDKSPQVQLTQPQETNQPQMKLSLSL